VRAQLERGATLTVRKARCSKTRSLAWQSQLLSFSTIFSFTRAANYDDSSVVW
jgi:hypothetical protein